MLMGVFRSVKSFTLYNGRISNKCYGWFTKVGCVNGVGVEKPDSKAVCLRENQRVVFQTNLISSSGSL